MNKKILTSLLVAFSCAIIPMVNRAQTTINFDNNANWTAGSVALGSYAVNHTYSEGVFSVEALPALRNGITAQDGVPGANGTYSWRLRDVDTSEWTCNIASGGVSTFSMAIRRWDASPTPDYTIEYSIDLGSSWNFVTTVNNTSLDGLSAWKTFTGTINSANPNIKIRIIANGPTERIMIDDFYWEPFGAPAAPTISFDNAATTVSESAGTLTMNVNLTNFDANAVDVNVALMGGTAINGIDFNFSPITLTFPGGANSTQTFTVDILEDVDFEPSETLIFSLMNPTNGAVLGTVSSKTISITDNDIPAITACSELFFSEYIEGTSNNKAVEIYNPSTSAITLSNYEVRLYSNGSPTVSSTLVLTGTLNPGETFVIANSQANAAILAKANVTSGVMSFTGNDALELYNTANSQTVDIIGEIGVDPTATGWSVGAGFTANTTIRRKSTINLGSTVWLGSGNMEWDVYGLDAFDGLKLHENTTCGSAIPVVAGVTSPAVPVCVGALITFGANAFGGVTPYTYTWDFGNGNSETTSLVVATYAYPASGTYNGTLTVVDANSQQSVVNFTVVIATPPTSGFTVDIVLCSALADVTSTATGNTLVYNYTSSPNLTIVSQDISTGAASISGTAGSHTLTQLVTDADGCTTTETQNVTITLAEDASFTTVQNVCQGETVSLSANNALGSWSGSGVTDNGNGTGLFNSAGLTGPTDITYSIIGICGSFSTEQIDVLEIPTANFTFTGTNEITFTNTSLNMVFPSAINWNYGDGNQETTFLDPVHEYTANGTYTVCLEVVNGNGCTDEICKTVTVIGVGIKENNTTSFEIFPNPSNGVFTVNYNGQATVTVTNIIGKTISKSALSNTSTIDLTEMPSGTYFVTVQGENFSKTKKVIIE
jgi:PKD repeat protein